MLTDNQLELLSQNLLDAFDNAKEPQEFFSKAQSLIDRIDFDEQWKLRSFYCDILSDIFLCGYYKYSRLSNIDMIKNNLYYIEFCNQIRKLDKNDPHNNLFFSIVNLVEKNYNSLIKDISDWIDAKAEDFRNADAQFDRIAFTYGLVTVLKEGFPGMWNELGDILSEKDVEKGLPSMCCALEKFYYSSDNEDIIDSLTQVIQENNDLAVAKELLGFVYYENKMWNNALALFEQIEETDCSECVLTEDTKFFYMAWCYGKRRDYQNEEKYYKKTLEACKDSDFALNNLGYSLYKQKKYQEAKAAFEKCIADNQNADFASNNMVRTLLAMGEANKAREFIKSSSVHISKELVRRAEKAVQKTPQEKSDLIKDDAETQVNKAVSLGVKKHQFSSEKLLEDELELRMEAEIPVFGLPLKVYQAKGAYGRQYIIPHGRIDILATDDKGNYYVIELKKDSGYDDAYTQTRTYVDWIQKHLAKNKKKVFGIICLNNPSKALIDKVRNDDSMKLFEYSISYSEIN